MNVLRWLADLFSNRGAALSLYKRGMRKAKRRDHEGAIDDYTAAIGVQGVAVDVKAMVLYNRALAHGANGETPKAVEDLDAILALDDVPVNVRTMARQRLFRLESRKKNA
jgi:hypothetical protein